MPLGHVIWKYKLKLEPEQQLTLPLVAVLSVQPQKNLEGKEELFLWAIVNPDAAEERTIRVYLCTTGGPLFQSVLYVHYLGTVQLDQGNFVAHVFVRTHGGV